MTTVQKIFRDSYHDYVETHVPSRIQAKAADSLMNCKTPGMGARSFECGNCGHCRVCYNSCRNRHCPQCQGVNKDIWVDRRKKDILDAPYFHVVFTMPKQLHMVIYQNQKLLYDLMYRAVAETLMELSGDRKYLGARIGFFSVLHTWGQNLHYHPHIHTVVLAGGLTEHNQWKMVDGKFFLPIKVLSKKFRGKYLYYLKKFYEKGELQFYGHMKRLRQPRHFHRLVDSCYSIDWYSYTKRTFSGPQAVMEYLGRYTHRIAISNNRIVSDDASTVTFRVRDYKENNRIRTVTLTKVEFIRRFLMHVLPKGFVKIRYYGILANRVKKEKLTRCRKLTKSKTYQPLFEGLPIHEVVSILLNKDITLCPGCKKDRLKPASEEVP
ncbi:IS91 family transposase [Bacillus sp. REN3]|uniref:IS91 family transposase n=1 Tax=Bacillus sp. REN3 TaxID=2802440 RepID=UPI001AED53DF|nr:IS91 family transposase [Bacillus sp. REN3]